MTEDGEDRVISDLLDDHVSPYEKDPRSVSRKGGLPLGYFDLGGHRAAENPLKVPPDTRGPPIEGSPISQHPKSKTQSSTSPSSQQGPESPVPAGLEGQVEVKSHSGINKSHPGMMLPPPAAGRV